MTLSSTPAGLHPRASRVRARDDRVRARDDRGATATEYGLLAAGVAALIAVVVFAFGDAVTDLYDRTCAEFATHVGGSCG